MKSCIDKYGEVFTPLSLVRRMFSLFPESIWENKDYLWIDHSCGNGSFLLAAKNILRQYYDEQHIVNNMLWGIDIRRSNIEITKHSTGIKNLICCDALRYNGGLKFNVVVGNPPYNNPKNGKKGNNTNPLWPLFVDLSLDRLLADGGYLLHVHPPLWRKPEHYLWEKFKQIQIDKLVILSQKVSTEIFGVMTKVDFYLARKINPYKETEIVDEFGKSCSIKIYDKPFVPNSNIEKVYVSENVDDTSFAGEYGGLYSKIPPQEIQNMLQTYDQRFIAVLAAKKGLVNSALLCEELAGYMSSKYGERFRLIEKTHVREITLYKEGVILKTEPHNISCDKVVLCTNGFCGFAIYNEHGADIDKWFKEQVKGVVGYMGGVLEEPGRDEAALTYFSDYSGRNDVPYYYLTRRNYSYSDKKKNLVCVGGPEEALEANETYYRSRRYPPGAREEIRDFLRTFYRNAPVNLELDYAWHGLMGYTRNMIRLIGPDPRNENLLYNLGCNGVGILPSVYGGKRIAEILSGIDGGDSIFDPRNSI